jgi:histidinol-phosphatase
MPVQDSTVTTAARNRHDRALDAALAAGRVALEYFDRPLEVEWKGDDSPVTIADKEAEETIRGMLERRYPGDGFLGEECGERPGSSGFRWVIDPIDGTRNFVRGIPLWATLIGLEHEGVPVAGICYLPALRQMFRAVRGEGAYRDSRRLHVSDVGTLAESQVFYSGLSWFLKSGVKDPFLDLMGRTARQRGFGDFYGFLLVAQGSGELMVDYGVHPWDITALIPIVEEAGGTFTDWDGNRNTERPDVLASNGKLHQEVLALLKAGRPAGFDPAVIEHERRIT